jgi:hypothetical protein
MESVLTENIGQISPKRSAVYLVEQVLTFKQISYLDNSLKSIPQTLISVSMIQSRHLSLCPVAEKINANPVRKMLNAKISIVADPNTYKFIFHGKHYCACMFCCVTHYRKQNYTDKSHR